VRLLQINTVVNSGSTGRIAEDIGRVLMDNGHESFIAYGRGSRPSQSELIKIGTMKDVYWHGLKTMVLDRHAFGSRKATEKFVAQLDTVRPDIVHLHNVHGYYLHVGVLFKYLSSRKIPVVWTLHDCWAYTGHCVHYQNIACQKWQKLCYACPKSRLYPASYFMDNSRKNYLDKRALFTSLDNLYLITPSKWLQQELSMSFLKGYESRTIHNGIDLGLFKPNSTSKDQNSRPYILGVANVWQQSKGLFDFFTLAELLKDKMDVVLIGLNAKNEYPVKALPRTESIAELAAWYSGATAFLNPTYSDNFPTTNIEALACGTPVITYATGGSPEAIDEQTGRVVSKGDVKGLVGAVEALAAQDQKILRSACRQRAEAHFDKAARFRDYIQLYEEILARRS
jgi:putative colanic acid biosynthesis glycosyltransferase